MTLVYQLAANFPSIWKDVNRVICDNPTLLDPDKSLSDQMEALFLQPLHNLQLRLRRCPPLTFVVNALDECTSKPELTDLILSLAWALSFQNREVQLLLCEIPMKTSGESVTTIISLDGTDVDKDIYIFLQHSFTELANCHTDFPQPLKDDLVKLLMLKLTSELLPGTEVYKLYDCILSTCANPKWAYIHLSIVAALTDPLPIAQILSLFSPGLGRDVQTMLIQLWSVMDIPTDSTLPPPSNM
ncbi:uncharacterized protein BJ212DRAFT_1481654 [Suillus subaureus]|uniref:Nephrocystin 3-like N-terminal domain-containing protein n=1 Tax=Suillus subaureus TaxID=48587 RepID=A0A9P7JCT0_9AGAM|nr:uncharacterized protein BJ212DRAFT_1481654 [Suillus subaureus]KAG1815126.1 hypothetical protein BJ212DRAFT_1481654 [Suillus subaureus]